MSEPAISQETRDYVDDMGFVVCEDCGTVFIPQPLPNDGHDCPVSEG